MGGGEEGMTRAGLLKIDLSKEYLLSLGYLGGKHRCILRKKKKQHCVRYFQQVTYIMPKIGFLFIFVTN